MASNVFTVDISKAESDKTLKKEIEKTVCALLNNIDGGKVILTTSKDQDKIDVDTKVRRCEQYFEGVIGAEFVKQYFTVSLVSDRRVELDVLPGLPILCTLCTNLPLPTNTETPLLPPIEQGALRKILFERRVVEISQHKIPDQLVHEEKLNLFQSKTVQFKNPRNKTDEDFASHAIKKEFTQSVARFANGSGGMVCYGINEDRTVVGELLSDVEEDRKEIAKELEEAVRKMIWPIKSGEVERGKQWDIKFVPVTNCDANEKRFVVVVSVAPCSGGVFIKEPESYYVESNKVKKMPFETWMEKTWRFEPWKTIEGKFRKNFEKSDDFNMKLICLLHGVVVDYHLGEFKAAQSCLEQFCEMMLSSSEIQPTRADYPKPASFTIKDGSLEIENEFKLRSHYQHASSVLDQLAENGSSVGTKKDDKNLGGHLRRAKDNCDTALQDLMHLNDDSELRQKINIMLALLYLKSAVEDLASSSKVSTAAEIKIKESGECIKDLEENETPFIDDKHALLLLAKFELHLEIAERCVQKTVKLADADGFEEIKKQCEILEKEMKEFNEK